MHHGGPSDSRCPGRSGTSRAVTAPAPGTSTAEEEDRPCPNQQVPVMTMPGDTRHNQHVEITFRYSEELSEDEPPIPGAQPPVLAPETYARVRARDVRRLFAFLTSISALCLVAVTLVPKTAVQVTAIGIFGAAAGIAHNLIPLPRKPRD